MDTLDILLAIQLIFLLIAAFFLGKFSESKNVFEILDKWKASNDEWAEHLKRVHHSHDDAVDKLEGIHIDKITWKEHNEAVLLNILERRS